jgi:hypothetical protein
MAKWTFSRTATLGGRFQIIITKPGYRPTDVTMLRGVPAQLSSYTNADPFGDATAQISFPQLTGFDDLDSADVGCWLGDFSNVDIWWLPAEQVEAGTGDVLSPLTNAADIITPVRTELGAEARIKVWEGLVVAVMRSSAPSALRSPGTGRGVGAGRSRHRSGSRGRSAGPPERVRTRRVRPAWRPVWVRPGRCGTGGRRRHAAIAATSPTRRCPARRGAGPARRAAAG